MSFKIKQTGFLKIKSSDIDSLVIKALGLTAQLVISDARELTPIDTGRLRNGWIQKSINYQSVVIGNRVEYAPYIEFGTRYITGRHMLEQALFKMQKDRSFIKILKRILKNESG